MLILGFVENQKDRIEGCATLMASFNAVDNYRHKVFAIKMLYYCAYLKAQDSGNNDTHVSKKQKTSQRSHYSFASYFGASVLLFMALEMRVPDIIIEFWDKYPRDSVKVGSPKFRTYKIHATLMTQTGLYTSSPVKSYVWKTLEKNRFLDPKAEFEKLQYFWRIGAYNNYMVFLDKVLVKTIKESSVTIEQMVSILIEELAP
jgi:hypothetical protein